MISSCDSPTLVALRTGTFAVCDTPYLVVLYDVLFKKLVKFVTFLLSSKTNDCIVIYTVVIV